MNFWYSIWFRAFRIVWYSFIVIKFVINSNVRLSLLCETLKPSTDLTFLFLCGHFANGVQNIKIKMLNITNFKTVLHTTNLRICCKINMLFAIFLRNAGGVKEEVYTFLDPTRSWKRVVRFITNSNVTRLLVKFSSLVECTVEEIEPTTFILS